MLGQLLFFIKIGDGYRHCDTFGKLPDCFGSKAPLKEFISFFSINSAISQRFDWNSKDQRDRYFSLDDSIQTRRLFLENGVALNWLLYFRKNRFLQHLLFKIPIFASHQNSTIRKQTANLIIIR
jgi:hypothetical protein